MTILRRATYHTLGVMNDVFGLKTKVFVLCYHGISTDSWRFNISIDEFKKQINFLLEKYSPITINDFEDYLSGKHDVKKPSFLLTFDDGYENVMKVRSFLKNKKIKPMLFLLGNSDKANKTELGYDGTFLKADQIKKLMSDGWTIGCHSMTHANLKTIQLSKMPYETRDAKDELQKKLGKEIKYYAYPRGKYNNEIVEAIKQSGFQFGFTMDDSFINEKTSRLAIPRIGVDKTHSFGEFKRLFTPLAVMARMGVKKSFLNNYL
jgi:peptidoglycan/xylan/chitin deacetylase (PgdA/CDA1 family)